MILLPIIAAGAYLWLVRLLEIERKARIHMAHHSAGNVETRIAWYEEIGRGSESLYQNGVLIARTQSRIIGVTEDDRIVRGQ